MLREELLGQHNKLLNAEKMRTNQVTQELDAERLGMEDALQQHVTEQTKKRVSDGNKEQNAVPLPAAPSPNKKLKKNMSGKSCDSDSLFAQLAGQSRQDDEVCNYSRDAGVLCSLACNNLRRTMQPRHASHGTTATTSSR